MPIYMNLGYKIGASVYLGVEKVSGKYYAVKVLDLEKKGTTKNYSE